MFNHAIFIIGQVGKLFDERDNCFDLYWSNKIGYRRIITISEMVEMVKEVDMRIENINEQLRGVADCLEGATKAIKGAKKCASK